MGDRFRLGEVLAAIGAVGLTVMLVFGTWLSYSSAGLTIIGLAPGQYVSGGLGVRSLGWFVVLLLGFAALGGLAFIFRVITSKDTERPMLQAPIAYAAALVAMPVLLVRLVLLRPNAVDLEAVRGPGGALVQLSGPYPTDVAAGGWLGLLFVMLLLIGTWWAMDDERTGTAYAKAQTDGLLDGLERRTVPAAEPATAAATATQAADNDPLPTEDDPATPPQDTP